MRWRGIGLTLEEGGHLMDDRCDCFSIVFRLIFDWFSIDFRLFFDCFSIDFRLFFDCFSIDFRLIFDCFSIDFRLICCCCSTDLGLLYLTIYIFSRFQFHGRRAAQVRFVFKMMKFALKVMKFALKRWLYFTRTAYRMVVWQVAF